MVMLLSLKMVRRRKRRKVLRKTLKKKVISVITYRLNDHFSNVCVCIRISNNIYTFVTGKGPGKKTIAAMQEALKKMKEEEERLKREEEERIRQEELREQARLEQLRLEQERKEKKKLKEKQRKERLKAEGKFLTTKQKQDRARAQAMIEALKAQGFDLPDVGEKKPRPGMVQIFLQSIYREIKVIVLIVAIILF